MTEETGMTIENYLNLKKDVAKQIFEDIEKQISERSDTGQICLNFDYEEWNELKKKWCE